MPRRKGECETLSVAVYQGCSARERDMRTVLVDLSAALHD